MATPAKRRRQCALVLALVSISSAALAAYPCTVDGRRTYQDKPCTNSAETVAQDLQARENTLRLHRKLDQLAEDGFGRMIPPRRTATPIPPAPPASAEPEYFVGRPRMSHAEREAKIRQSLASADAQARQKNQESAARLTEIFDHAKRDCGGALPNLPVLGISDEAFRMCTVFARTNTPYQVVVANEGTLLLRLYLYESQSIERVYTVGGVVTAIRP